MTNFHKRISTNKLSHCIKQRLLRWRLYNFLNYILIILLVYFGRQRTLIFNFLFCVVTADKWTRASTTTTKSLPWIRAILDSLLSIFSPSISIFQMINLTLGHKGKPWLSLLFLSFLLCFSPVDLTININCTILAICENI